MKYIIVRKGRDMIQMEYEGDDIPNYEGFELVQFGDTDEDKVNEILKDEQTEEII